MAKFNVGGTQAGQISDLQRQAAIDLPVGQPELLEEPAAEAGPQSFQDLLDPAIAEQLPIQEEIDKQRIPSLNEQARTQDTEWYPQGAPNPRVNFDADEDMMGRADRLSQEFSGPEPLRHFGLMPTTVAGREAATNEDYQAVSDAEYGVSPGSLAATLVGLGAAQPRQDPVTNKWDNSLDPTFLKVVSAVTENQLANLISSGETEVEADPLTEIDEIEEMQDTEISNAKGNAQLGMEIARSYSRIRNEQQGKRTDDFEDISREAATVLGDAAKRIYALANPRILAPVDIGTRQKGWKVIGPEILEASETQRKRLFPKTNVRPQKQATGGTLVGEVGKRSKRGRRFVGKVGGQPQGAKTIVEAMNNLAEVPNVVDPQRMRVLFTTLLPVLSGAVPAESWMANINNIGDKAFKGMEAKNPATAQKSFNRLKQKIANEVQSIATERKGANYLTYYVQNFNGRIAPQQTAFDPTTSKAVRFVTRNAVPSKANGNRIEKNLRQMYAMMLIPASLTGKDNKADTALPAEREVLLERHAGTLERWGDMLSAALDQAMTATQAEAVAQAIQDGIPANDPNFPQVTPLNITDESLVAAIAAKGEDGPAFIDGLIDFSKYAKARRKDKPYYSYFNAYIDGKTNGIASNGMQMGHMPTALATGVARRKQATQLLDEGDIRDQLADILTESLDNNGLTGHYDSNLAPLVKEVARDLFNFRDLNKATTMTFGYGKEISSFKKDLEEHIRLLAADTEGYPNFGTNIAAINEAGINMEELVENLISSYEAGMRQVMSPEAVASREIMKSAATLVGVLDQLFALQGPTGFMLNLGADVERGTFKEDETGAKVEPTRYSLYEGDTRTRPAVPHYASEPTSSAARLRDGRWVPGNRAYGGSVPAPVQALDAATVAKTASGKSWDKLKARSAGHPYLHTIYDAFKMDAMGYDTVLEEVNKNWVDLNMQWSYLEETKKALERSIPAGLKKLDELGNEVVDTSTHGPYNMFGFYTSVNDKGELEPLMKLFKKLLEDSDQAKAAANRVNNRLHAAGWKPNKPATAKHVKAFYLGLVNELKVKERLDAMIRTTNKNKEELRKEIKSRPDNEVLQYYSH